MVVSNRLFFGAPQQIFLDSVIDAYAGSHGGYLMCHVQQIAGAQPGNRLHLRRRFYLKDADGISFTKHVVDRLILEIDA